ncbi:MAG TPA: glycosyltransferase [Burkholderiales bacterium]|nr:glycosyltransferase [Burkholderiales bacterium]
MNEHALRAQALIARHEYALAAEELALLARLEPGNATWPAAQADCHGRNGDMEGAARCLEAALALAPREAMLWTKLGYARWELALVDDAIAAYRGAVDREPAAEPAGGNLLFALLHRLESPAAYLHEARRWARFASPPDAASAESFSNTRKAGRRLRIGYVSADMRNHAMAPFIEAMLAWHDTARFELVCYDGTPKADDVSARLRSHVTHWRPTAKLDDTNFAALVRADEIDILVDLSGHTAGNRLRAFARRLAPLQVCNHGCPATTGLECFDWRLTDAANDPPGSADAYYTEPLYRLDGFSFCYRPAARSPVARHGGSEFTFASLNNVRKITPRMVELWAKILQRLPATQLLIAGTPPGPARERILAQLASAGVAAHRVVVHGWLGPERYAALHASIDVALDTFPYNGSTTTFEALYHGVPVITLAGPVFVSGHGRATLEALGEARFVAFTDDDYIAVAMQVHAARNELHTLRRELHERMVNSPMLDARGYTARLELAYQDMWRQWCARGG